MICHRISELLGLTCHPLTEDGQIAMIDSPFTYPDGDDIPIYIEKLGPQIRFFDDGGALLHLLGRGITLDDHRKTKFIRNIAEHNHVTLTELGELEIWATEEDAPSAFANYIATMLSLAKWETAQACVSTDMSFFLDEVAMCLRAWKPNAHITVGPEYTGISGHVYKLDFSMDRDVVIALNPHHASVGSAAKKLLDIRAVSTYANLKVIVVMDDRQEEDAAKREGRVLESVGNVMMMSALERQAATSGALN